MSAPAAQPFGPTVPLEEVARRARALVVDMCASPEGGHLGGSLSLVEILTTLYFRVLSIDPARPDAPERDVLILSKGHGAIGLYAVLALRGFLATEELATYGRPGSRLAGHPVRAVPGVEMPTGSLGHGLALGVGCALGARHRGWDRRTVVVLGDGELQEGSIWEAAMAGASLGLDRLTVIVDRNRLQLTGRTEEICPLEPLAPRWEAFGWAVTEVDGHDMDALAAALDRAPSEPGRPSVLIARTVQGHGLPFAEDRVGAHYARLSERQRARAQRHLDRAATAGGNQ